MSKTCVQSKIVAVTQQFAKPFDHIPHGWKTICVIQFEGGIPDIVKRLPEVNSWCEAKNPVCLCDENTWSQHAEVECLY